MGFFGQTIPNSNGSPAGLAREASEAGSAWREAGGWGQGSAPRLDFGIQTYHVF